MATTPTTTTTTPPSTPVIHGPINIDYLNESWCELQYKSGCSSTGSISHLHHTVNPEVLEKLLHEAQKEVQATFASQKLSSSSSNSSSTTNLINASNTLNLESSTLLSNHQTESSTPLLLTKSDVKSPPSLSSEIDSPFTSLSPPLHMSKSNIECSHCLMHKREIDSLLDKQHRQQRLILGLQKQQEQMLMNKSPKLLATPPSISSSFVAAAAAVSSSSSSTTSSTSHSSASPSPAALAASLRRQSNSVCCVTAPEQSDWIKCWSSRPQTEPPKEWNFVHPNNADFKLNNMNMLRKLDMETGNSSEALESKLLTKENIGKLIVTHMASFILGATLMYLILRKHLNIRSSKQLYFV